MIYLRFKVIWRSNLNSPRETDTYLPVTSNEALVTQCADIYILINVCFIYFIQISNRKLQSIVIVKNCKLYDCI